MARGNARAAIGNPNGKGLFSEIEKIVREKAEDGATKLHRVLAPRGMRATSYVPTLAKPGYLLSMDVLHRESGTDQPGVPEISSRKS